MPINTTFKAAIQRLAELAGHDQPGYVSVRAASQLANILSPANPKHGDILHALNDDQPQADHAALLDQPAQHDEHPYACYVRKTEEAEETEESEESDESEGANQDDEPP